MIRKGSDKLRDVKEPFAFVVLLILVVTTNSIYHY